MTNDAAFSFLSGGIVHVLLRIYEMLMEIPINFIKSYFGMMTKAKICDTIRNNCK